MLKAIEQRNGVVLSRPLSERLVVLVGDENMHCKFELTRRSKIRATVKIEFAKLIKGVQKEQGKFINILDFVKQIRKSKNDFEWFNENYNKIINNIANQNINIT